MGLRQIKPGSLFSNARSWVLPAVIAVLCLLGLAIGDALRDQLRYERSAIGAGELYRLLSGHFVHLGVGHALLNVFGLGLVWVLVGGVYSAMRWIMALGVVVVTIDLGFWYLLPSLDWYVGLSGVLHGLLVAGLVGGFRARQWESLILGGVVAAKLVYEAVAGPMPGSADAAGGAVIVEAHLYGAVGGLVAGAMLLLVGRR